MGTAAGEASSSRGADRDVWTCGTGVVRSDSFVFIFNLLRKNEQRVFESSLNFRERQDSSFVWKALTSLKFHKSSSRWSKGASPSASSFRLLLRLVLTILASHSLFSPKVWFQNLLTGLRFHISASWWATELILSSTESSWKTQISGLAYSKLRKHLV